MRRVAEQPVEAETTAGPTTTLPPGLTEAELDRQARRGSPDAVAGDAVPWRPGASVDEPGDRSVGGLGRPGEGAAVPACALPDWYSPVSLAGHGRATGRARLVAWVVVIALLAVVMSGLCVTYGVIELA